MNGWQRLWVAVSGISTIAIFTFIALNFETEGYVDESYKMEIDRLHAIKKDIGHPTAGSELLRQNYTIAEVDSMIAKTGLQYQNKLISLPKEHVTAIIRAIIASLVFSALLYGAGFTINWVYRGFRPKRA